jgi:hypothetical protein
VTGLPSGATMGLRNRNWTEYSMGYLISNCHPLSYGNDVHTWNLIFGSPPEASNFCNNVHLFTYY